MNVLGKELLHNDNEKKALHIFSMYAKRAFRERWDKHINLSFSVEEVCINDVRFCVSFLSPNNVDYLKNILRSNLMKYNSLFEFSVEEMEVGHFLPLIEITNNENIILDGAHRLFAAYTLGFKSVPALILSSDNHPPPCSKTYQIGEIKLREVPVRSHEIIFDDMNEDLFRPMRIILNDIKQHIERSTIMITSDFNWTPDKNNYTNEAIKAAIPNRATLAETDIIINGNNEVLLVDPHSSGTWETWMFPYASLILPIDRLQIENPDLAFLLLDENSLLNDVSNAMDEIMNKYLNEYRQALRDGVNQLIPELIDANGEIVSIDYSLKFSKTSNSYTAYRFNSKKILIRKEELNISIPHIWISKADIISLGDSEKVEGKLIAKNVTETIEGLRL